MTIVNLYAKYLLADRLNKIAEAANVKVYSIDIMQGDKHSPDIHIQASAWGNRRDGESDNDAERAAIRLLDAMPSLNLERSSGLIYLVGESGNGLTYRFYTGSGSCELVQVGTRTVPAQRRIPAVKAQPAYEEPIFERRCVDPLNALVSA